MRNEAEAVRGGEGALLRLQLVATRACAKSKPAARRARAHTRSRAGGRAARYQRAAEAAEALLP